MKLTLEITRCNHMPFLDRPKYNRCLAQWISQLTMCLSVVLRQVFCEKGTFEENVRVRDSVNGIFGGRCWVLTLLIKMIRKDSFHLLFLVLSMILYCSTAIFYVYSIGPARD